jgi:hypothetical protein
VNVVDPTLQHAAVACTTCGLVAASAVFVRGQDVRLTIGVLLDLLLAAGLLRLSGDPTPRTILTATVIIAIRKIVSFGVAQRAAAAPAS